MKNKLNILDLYKILENKEVKKEDILKKFNIKPSTFHNKIHAIKNIGFNIIRKNKAYKILQYQNIVSFDKNEEEIILDMINLAYNFEDEKKTKAFLDLLEKILLMTNFDFSQNIKNKTKRKRKKQKQNIKPKPKNSKEIIFEIKGRMKNIYCLKENERIIDTQEDKIIVGILEDDKQKLFKRLLRYDTNCEILYPKEIREEFRQFLRRTMENLGIWRISMND